MIRRLVHHAVGAGPAKSRMHALAMFLILWWVTFIALFAIVSLIVNVIGVHVRGGGLNVMHFVFAFVFLVPFAFGLFVLNEKWPRGAKKRHCRACGFDLRGLPRSGVCPECGQGYVRS